MQCTLFVGNLAFNTTPAELEAAFSPYGNVAGVKIPTDRQTNRPRGFGFVTFDRKDEAEEAMQKMNGKELKGRQIRVNIAQERQDDSRGKGRF